MKGHIPKLRKYKFFRKIRKLKFYAKTRRVRFVPKRVLDMKRPKWKRYQIRLSKESFRASRKSLKVPLFRNKKKLLVQRFFKKFLFKRKKATRYSFFQKRMPLLKLNLKTNTFKHLLRFKSIKTFKNTEIKNTLSFLKKIKYLKNKLKKIKQKKILIKINKLKSKQNHIIYLIKHFYRKYIFFNQASTTQMLKKVFKLNRKRNKKIFKKLNIQKRNTFNLSKKLNRKLEKATNLQIKKEIESFKKLIKAEKKRKKLEKKKQKQKNKQKQKIEHQHNKVQKEPLTKQQKLRKIFKLKKYKIYLHLILSIILKIKEKFLNTKLSLLEKKLTFQNKIKKSTLYKLKFKSQILKKKLKIKRRKIKKFAKKNIKKIKKVKKVKNKIKRRKIKKRKLIRKVNLKHLKLKIKYLMKRKGLTLAKKKYKTNYSIFKIKKNILGKKLLKKRLRKLKKFKKKNKRLIKHKYTKHNKNKKLKSKHNKKFKKRKKLTKKKINILRALKSKYTLKPLLLLQKKIHNFILKKKNRRFIKKNILKKKVFKTIKYKFKFFFHRRKYKNVYLNNPFFIKLPPRIRSSKNFWQKKYKKLVGFRLATKLDFNNKIKTGKNWKSFNFKNVLIERYFKLFFRLDFILFNLGYVKSIYDAVFKINTNWISSSNNEIFSSKKYITEGSLIHINDNNLYLNYSRLNYVKRWSYSSYLMQDPYSQTILLLKDSNNLNNNDMILTNINKSVKLNKLR